MNKSISQVLFNRGFLTLFLCYTPACTCFAFVNVGLLLHATEDFGMDSVIVGSVIGAVSLIGLCMRPISALIVDRLNRKRVLMFAFALEAVATFGFAYADQYVLMYILQIMRGVAWGLINCAGVVLIVDIIGREDLGMATGIYAIGMVIGSSIASAVVATMGDLIGFVFTFLIASSMTALASILACTIPVKHHKLDHSITEDSAQKNAAHERRPSIARDIVNQIKSIRLSNVFAIECAPILLISFTFQLCSTALGATFLVAYGRTDLTIANVGIAATLYNVIMYFSRPIYGRIMDKYGAKWCIIPTFFGFIAANFIAAMSSDMSGLFLAAIVFGLCSGGHSIAPRVLAIRRIGKHREAVAASTSGIGNDIGMFLGNILVPAVAAIFGGYYRNAYLVMAGIALIGFIYCLTYIHLYLKRHPENSIKW